MNFCRTEEVCVILRLEIYKGSGEWHVGSRKKKECCSKRGASFLLKSWWGQWCWNKRPVPHPTRGSTYIRWAKSFSVRTIKSKTKSWLRRPREEEQDDDNDDEENWRNIQRLDGPHPIFHMPGVNETFCQFVKNNLVQTNVGINQWWWRKGVSFWRLD